MASFTIDEVLEATGATLLQPYSKACTFTQVETDTRAITADSLFIAFKGERFDGHRFVCDAVKAGAVGAVVSDVRDEYHEVDGPIFVVPNTLKAYQALARYHRRRFAIPVVAVTGSVGKTSTRNLIATVLSQKYHVLQTEKNFNNEIGLPKTLLQLTEEHEACVVEMGMRGLGQIAELADIAEPTIGVVTNVGKSHIELLGSQENIAKAKSELVCALDGNGIAVLNNDDDFVRPMAALCKGKVVTYGVTNPSDVQGSSVVMNEKGLHATCRLFDTSFDVTIPVIGRHHVYNGLAAAAVGRITGLSDEEIAQGLSAYKGVAMREELVHIDTYTFINDTYNANPASMSSAIHTLSALGKQRKIAVLGGMGELGDWAPREHAAIGRLIANEKIDILITLGELAGDIAAAAREEGMEAVYQVQTHEEGARILQTLLQPNDTILLKGSRAFEMEKILPYFERK